jgi:hypothetical protein
MRIKHCFWINFAALLFLPTYFNWHLCFFAPSLALSFYRLAPFKCWLLSIACGLIMDIFSTSPLFGLTSVIYFATSLFLQKQQRHFFEDKLTTLPLMTLLFSALSTLFFILWYAMTSPFSVNLESLATDLLLMPACDGIYALITCTLPLLAVKKFKKMAFRRKIGAA